jgi:hypothetical protein
LNILGLTFQIIGVVIIVMKIRRLELVQGAFDSDHYVDPKTKKQPKVITLPDQNLTKGSVILIGLGLLIQIIATLYPRCHFNQILYLILSQI